MVKEQVRQETRQPKVGTPETDGFIRTLNTRFGEITLDARTVCYLPYGLLGFGDCNQFCLTHIPSKPDSSFKLLQSLDDESVTFVTLPIPFKNSFIEADDINDTAALLGILEEDLLVLLIVSSSQVGNQTHTGVNLRAPIFMDTARNLAVQHVFRDNKYPVMFKIK